MVIFFVYFTYVCICQLHLRHVHHRRNPLCNGRRRRRQCCKCTWGTRPTLVYSCPQHWGRCCYCSCRHGMPGLDHFHQEGPQRSHHHIVHTSYLETVKVGDDHVLYYLLYWISKTDWMLRACTCGSSWAVCTDHLFGTGHHGTCGTCGAGTGFTLWRWADRRVIIEPVFTPLAAHAGGVVLAVTHSCKYKTKLPCNTTHHHKMVTLYKHKGKSITTTLDYCSLICTQWILCKHGLFRKIPKYVFSQHLKSLNVILKLFRPLC